MIRGICRQLALMALMLTAGCSSRMPAPQPPAPASSAPLLSAFTLEARIAARRGDEAVHGRLIWQHGPAVDQFEVYSPFGQQIARLTVRGSQARLEQPGALPRDGARDALLTALLGVRLPYDRLPAWVQARDIPADQVRERDDEGRIRRSVDAGWSLFVSAYEAPGTDALPARLALTRHDQSVRLILDRWQMP